MVTFCFWSVGELAIRLQLLSLHVLQV